jgi:hypothetical protein
LAVTRLADGKHSAFFVEITAIHNDSTCKLKPNPIAATILMLSARYLEAKNKKDEGGYNDVDGNPSFFELWNRMHSML